MGRDLDPVVNDSGPLDVAIELAGVGLHSADLDAIVAIETVSFDRPWSRQSFADEFGIPTSKFWVVRQRPSGAVVGYACCRQVEDELQILNLAVAPDCRRHTIGRRLLQTILDQARATGHGVVLEVEVGNEAACRLYEAAGFDPIGRRKDFYGRGRDGLILARTADVGTAH